MLFDVLLTICVVYLMILPFFVVKFIAYGVKLALVEEKEEVPAFVDAPKIKHRETKAEKKQRTEQEKEIRKINSVLANIDRYDGTDNGQEEIK